MVKLAFAAALLAAAYTLDRWLDADEGTEFEDYEEGDPLE